MIQSPPINRMPDTCKRKIALVTPSLPPSATDGISSSHYNLYMLLKDTYKVRVYTYNDGLFSVSSEPDILRNGLSRVLQILISGIIRLVLLLLGARGAVYQCRDALLGALAGLKLLRDIKSFAPDIIIVPDQGPTSAFWPNSVGGKKIFVSHHNSMRFHREPLLGTHSALDARFGRYLEQMAVAKADLVVCPSNYMKDTFIETYRFSCPVVVLPNVIDGNGLDLITASALQKQLALSEDAPIIYIPSAGSIYKGRSFVTGIIQRLSREHPGGIGFYLSGNIDDNLRNELSSLPDWVKICAPGTVAHHENIANIKSCHLCISPTIIENFSMALLEAQWLGLPVISFDIGGNRDVVVDGTTGFLVQFPDSLALIEKALSLLHAPGQLQAFSRAAQDVTRNRFQPSIMLDQYARAFTQLLQQQSGGGV